MSTSYPLLTLARDLGLPYGALLNRSDLVTGQVVRARLEGKGGLSAMFAKGYWESIADLALDPAPTDRAELRAWQASHEDIMEAIDARLLQIHREVFGR